MEPYFFLSYARVDDDGTAIGTFYQDLRAELAARDPEAATQPSFRDTERIFLGADWERVLANAIAGCRAMVALYSPAYFASVYCGKEWTAFRSRVTAFQADTGWDAGALLPVLWEPLPGGPPPPADEVQYRVPQMGERYAEVGLHQLIREDPHGAEYRTVVEVLAGRVRQAAGRVRLPGLPGLNLREFQGAFPVRTTGQPPVLRTVEVGPAEQREPARVGADVPRHVFVSYAPAERMWAEWAATELTALGYRVSLHGIAAPLRGRSAEAGWAAKGTGRVLALLSPDYLQYARSGELWRALAGREVAPGIPALIPLRVKEMDQALPRLFAEQPVRDVVRTSAADSLARLTAAVGRLPPGQVPPTDGPAPVRPWRVGFPGELPPVLDCPARNPAFTGRDEELEVLRNGFGNEPATNVQVLFGLGGVGKTQTATEYAHRFRSGYDVVWWIPAEQIEFVGPRLAQLAPRIGLEGADDSSDTASRVLAALRAGRPYGRWLLVFDNAGAPEELAGWLPTGPPGGHVLITSRDPAWARHAGQVEVGVFRRPESLLLLRRLNPGLAVAAADQVARSLGDLPLAIAQAAAWLQESGMPVAGYLELLEATLTEMLERTRLPEGDYPRSAAATWLLSLEELRRTNARAAELLELCAHFGPDPIPTKALFSPLMARRLRLSHDDAGARMEIGELVRTIHRTGLARADSSSASLTVHRLVQAVIRDQVAVERRADVRRTVQLTLAGAGPQEPDLVGNWDGFAELLPHLWPSGAASSEDPEVRQWIINSVRYQWKRGMDQAARELAERTLEQWDRMADDGSGSGRAGDPYPGMLSLQLANVLRSQGEYRECHNIDHEVVLRFRRELGPRHPQTLIASSGLAADLRALGRFGEARELDRATVETAEQVLGKSHRRFWMMANNLALSEFLVGDRQLALDLHRRAYRHQHRVLGAASLDTLSSASSYARLLREKGQLRESLGLLEETVQIYRRTIGERHTDALWARRNLAMTLYRLGRLAQARELGGEVYRGCTEVLGPQSPDTLAAAGSFAAALRALGEHGQAVRIAGETYRQCRQQFGERHPMTAAVAGNLAVHLRATGKTGEARALSQEALAKLQAALGADHPYLGAVMVNHATDLALDGDRSGAARLGRRASELLTGALGPDHYDSLTAQSNLALDLAEAGLRDRAERLRAECADRAEGALGEGHPITRAVTAGLRLDAELEPCVI
ncbi:tetratricopeptide (TPR) repeat protein [Kitasatospora sp. MAP12-15]|uniref:FxSxx-COOH system tetratricopeptide repeat protein n=1 Tax=unclassified Kitasatospora TaxID=2633591 RepID=UPI002475DC92|nr:FxSxx-COOH system tetratricopeptide repeat protein [Kitasatospora sp. MAP12-44]MDH6112326.1 tetratricopeptide (TPR) repeat protein [Kitasatospora sp. MAP12-44]